MAVLPRAVVAQPGATPGRGVMVSPCDTCGSTDTVTVDLAGATETECAQCGSHRRDVDRRRR